MELFKFDKCLLDRLQEQMNVLAWKNEIISACQVRAEWSYFIELQIEPVGWKALWNIPRVICEELQIHYPTIVFGQVEKILFKELSAIFIVEAVQDDVHLPECHEVALVDLFPTLFQENCELNIERTADCLDGLRFFYTHIWMPWDNESDDDINWVEKHLESRVRFFYDLQKETVARPLVIHIRSLIAEAKYLQQRREYLELELSDGDFEELEDTLDTSELTELMRLHLRLAIIRNEVELLENPEMRRIYEETKYPGTMRLKNADKNKKDINKRIFVVILPSLIERQIHLLQNIQQTVPADSAAQIFSSLQDVLKHCDTSDDIYLSPGQHEIKYLENFKEQHSLVGICDNKHKLNDGDGFSKNNTIITSIDGNSILLVLDGSFVLKNLVLDCRNVCSGIVVKSGIVCLQNCRLIGDGKSHTQQGIICCTGAKLVLEECQIEKFGKGITSIENAVLHLTNTSVINCPIGLDLSLNSEIHLRKFCILNAGRSGIYIGCNSKTPEEFKTKSFDNMKELEKHLDTTKQWIGDCHFCGCKVNIFVLNKSKFTASKEALRRIYYDDDTSGYSHKCLSINASNVD